jgi:hypothetical protein
MCGESDDDKRYTVIENDQLSPALELKIEFVRRHVLRTANACHKEISRINPTEIS